MVHFPKDVDPVRMSDLENIRTFFETTRCQVADNTGRRCNQPMTQRIVAGYFSLAACDNHIPAAQMQIIHSIDLPDVTDAPYINAWAYVWNAWGGGKYYLPPSRIAECRAYIAAHENGWNPCQVCGDLLIDARGRRNPFYYPVLRDGALLPVCGFFCRHCLTVRTWSDAEVRRRWASLSDDALCTALPPVVAPLEGTFDEYGTFIPTAEAIDRALQAILSLPDDRLRYYAILHLSPVSRYGQGRTEVARREAGLPARPAVPSLEDAIAPLMRRDALSDSPQEA